MKIQNFYIEDMVESIELILDYLNGVVEVDFSKDMKLQDAVIRRLVIIGEAATKLSDEIKGKAPEIPWKTIIAFRNVAIHEYATVSMGKVWEIYVQDLPPLYDQLKKLLETLPPPPKPGEM